MGIVAVADPANILVLRAPRTPRQAENSVRVAAHKLARRLSALGSLSEVSDLIVRSIAKTIGARVVSLAVPESDGDRLSIVATCGYPLALVKDLRLRSGVGVLGSVYQAAAPLRVDDVSTFPGIERRRLRYQTNSLMALPLKAGGEVVAVVCVSDRLDGQPFSRRDMSTLRALAAPATLALWAARGRAQAESFAHAAAVDPVSGLFNRRYFQVRVEEELQRARRHRMPVALLLIDLDDFKQVNDTFGHLVGDGVIRDTADILRRSVRVFDVCTRFGGDEFAIVMPGSGPDAASSIAERIRQGVESYRPADLRTLRVTASVGVVVSTSEVAVRDLLLRADQALYTAKRSGKNQVRAVPALDPA